VPTGSERQQRDFYVTQLGDRDEVLDLPAERCGATDRPAQRRLIDDRPQVRWAGPVQDLLAVHAHGEAALQPLAGGVIGEPEYRAGVLLGLQQAGDELDLVAADEAGSLLEPQVGVKPGGHHVAVGVPPVWRVGVPGQGQQRGPLGLVVQAVKFQQVGHVAQLEAGPAQLEAADLGRRCADRLARVLPRDASILAKVAQFGA